MKINFNISAMIANNSLAKTERGLASVTEKLSSGLKINHAKDDASGMAISKKMREQIDALGKGNQNAQDAVSLLQTAEGAISEIQSMLQRMRELAIQAGNATFTAEDRQSIQDEVDALVKEVDRISKDTEFNGIPLLDGTLQEKGFTSQPDYVTVDYFTTAVTAQKYVVSLTSPPEKAVATTTTAVTLPEPIPASMAGTVTINGFSVKVEEGDAATAVYEKLRQAASCADVNLYSISVPTAPPALTPDNLDSAGYATTPFSNTSTALLFVSKEYGSDTCVTVACDNADLSNALQLSSSSSYDAAEGKIHDYGKDTQITLDSGFGTTATVQSHEDSVTITDLNGVEIALTISPLTDASKPIVLDVTDMGDLSIQVGAKENQNISISLENCSSKALGIDHINMIATESITKSLHEIDNGLEHITRIRSRIGAYENRLDSAISSIGQTNENMEAAYSRIMDTDMAEAMTEFTQKNVMNQAATAMLAQANDLPQTVLQLLS